MRRPAAPSQLTNLSYHTPRLILCPTAEQVREAQDAARLRTAFHNGYRRPQQESGSTAQNTRRDHYGLLSEILARDLLKARLPGLQTAPLYSETPQDWRQPDLPTVGADIKASPPDRYFICISEPAHQAGRGIVLRYVLVLFETP